MASFITIISFVLFIALSANGLVIKPRIVGGNDAEMNQFPYNVGLFMDSDNAKMIVCGGAIIGERHILSSGACGKAVEEELHKFVAILGTPEYDGMMIQIKIDKVHLHPRFKIESLKNDLAMLRTAKKMCFFDLVRPIALPVVDLESDDGVSAVVTSWGFLNQPQEWYDFQVPEKLQYQQTTTLRFGNCVSAYAAAITDREELEGVQHRFRDTNKICTQATKEESICLADMGAPLVANDTLIGVASWVIDCERGLPNVYTKVYPHLTWIHQEMQDILEDDDDSDEYDIDALNQCNPQ